MPTIPKRITDVSLRGIRRSRKGERPIWVKDTKLPGFYAWLSHLGTVAFYCKKNRGDRTITVPLGKNLKAADAEVKFYEAVAAVGNGASHPGFAQILADLRNDGIFDAPRQAVLGCSTGAPRKRKRRSVMRLAVSESPQRKGRPTKVIEPRRHRRLAALRSQRAATPLCRSLRSRS